MPFRYLRIVKYSLYNLFLSITLPFNANNNFISTIIISKHSFKKNCLRLKSKKKNN